MKKKFLFLESRYDSFYGAQKSMLKLIQSLDTSHNYKVVTTGKGDLKKGLEQNGVYVNVLKLGRKANVFGGKVIDYNIFKKFLVILQVIFYNFKLLIYLRKEKIDVVYVNDLRAFLYSVIAIKILRKKSVWYIRLGVSDSFLTKLGLRFCDYIITIAHGVLSDIPKEKIQNYTNKIQNIYTGFDFDQYQLIDKKESKRTYNLSEKSYIIGYLGSINQRKGLDLLVDAYINLSKRRNDIELFIVGDVSTGHEEYWEKQVNKLKKEKAKFKQSPFSEVISKAYCAMDVFVLPSRSEGLPRVVIEAMAHQLPVIATDVGGTNEIINDKTKGIIINKEDKKSLINAMEALLNNEEYSHELGKGGKNYVESKFNEKKFRSEINNFFKSI